MATPNTNVSIVDYLNSTGQASDFNTRAGLASKNGISGYIGTAEQNLSLLGLLKGGAPVVPKPEVTIPPANTTDANTSINSGQATDFKTASKTAEPATRTSAQNYADVYNSITSTLTKDLPTKPSATSMVDTYKAMRSDTAVTTLESSLADLNKQARDIAALNQVQMDAETGKPVAMNVIEGRMTEEQKQNQQKLTSINNSIKTITDQLTTKYNVIDNLMKYTGEDYANSVDAYDKQFTQNLNILNTVKGMVDTQKTDTERIADDARANAQIIINTMANTGTTYDKLGTTEKATLTKLGLESGLGQNFFSDVLKFSAGKDILTTVVSDDKTTATIMYKDGTTKKISTGLSASASTGNLTTAEVKNQGFNDINGILDTKGATTASGDPVKDSNGYITPKGLQALIKYGATVGISRSDLLSTYGSDLYAGDNGDYAGYGLNQKEISTLTY